MNKIIHLKISALAFCFFIFAPQILWSQAAAIPDEAAYQKMEQQFEAPQVSSEQLFLFEKKGIQHLKEFLNLVEMIAAEKLDAKFQGRFESAAINYFSNETDSILILANGKQKIFSIENFIKKVVPKNSAYQNLKLSKFESTTPVFLENKYTWEVSFLFSQKEKEDRKMRAIFILKKVKKTFGSVEKEVWEVLIEKIVEKKM